MESYLIGGGAILAAGDHGTITRATLHAQLAPVCDEPRAVLIDFEGGSMMDMRRLVALGVGMTAERFETTVTSRLVAAGACGFEDVAFILAHEVETHEVHLFARWAPGLGTLEALRARGLELVVHPLEAIVQAALIAEHRFTVWPGSRAA